MRFPFQHKEEEGTIPFYEVKKLREEGKSDKEIINQLKNRGYSFQAIEKAMLQVLREGVRAKEELPKLGAQPREYLPPQPTIPKREEVRRELPTREEIVPEPRLSLPVSGQVPLEAQFEPVDLIEEVVEGVVEEKFEKLDSKFEYIYQEQEKLKKEVEKLKNLIGSSIQREDKSIDNLKKEIEKLREEIQDLVIRSNALERAFKQFLPDIFVKARERKLEEKGVKVLDEEEKE